MSDARVLVVAPHHDDEAIGCGGLLLRQGDSGATLSVVFVFAPLEGEASAAGARRLEEAAAAGALLGIGDAEHLALRCRSGCSTSRLAWKLVKTMRRVRPTMVLVPHARERDPEHRLAQRAAIEAAWLSASAFRPELGPPAPSISTMLGYEVWTPIARPQMLVDITDVISRKERAIEAYSSQLEAHAYAEASVGLARYRGALMANWKYAEAFTVERMDGSRL